MNTRFIKKFEDLVAIDKIPDANLQRQKGLEFEGLINDIFTVEGSLIRRGYHTSDGKSEQIDGAIEIWNRILLLEVKWVSGNLAASDLYGFIGKIENKFHGTIGVFVSRNPLTSNFISSLNRGRRQNVIVVHGEDIDLLFTPDGPKLSDYLEYCIKLLSYENITHFPVSKYILVEKEPKALQANEVQQARDFVQNTLNNKEKVPVEDIVAQFQLMQPEAKNTVYQFALDNFSKIWASNLLNFTSYVRENYRELFAQLSSNDAFIKNTVNHYFTEILLQDFTIYSREELWNLYKPWYTSLSQEAKNQFEAHLIKEFEKAIYHNDWNSENDITLVVKDLWSEFSTTTIECLKNIYLSIYTSTNRSDKYPQKQFAGYLLDNGIITKVEIESWLEERLRPVAEEYKQKQAEVPLGIVTFLLNAYYVLGRYIEVDVLDFHVYLDGILEKLKNE